MTPFGRAAALWWTTSVAGLVLAVGVSAVASDALAIAPKVPLPKPRPIARSLVPKTTVAKPVTADAASPAPSIQPATRQHAALPPPVLRKPAPAPVLAPTSSTSQADTEVLH